MDHGIKKGHGVKEASPKPNGKIFRTDPKSLHGICLPCLPQAGAGRLAEECISIDFFAPPPSVTYI
jgi:hypothetical protein